MFLKIIHKSKASHLCSYPKRSYTESIGLSFNTQYLYPKFFNVRDKVYCKVSRSSKAEQSKILDNIINVIVGNQQNNLLDKKETATTLS